MQQGNGDTPQRISAMNSWSPDPDGNEPTAKQPPRAMPPSGPTPPQPRPRSGLLSNWNAGNSQNPQPQQQPGTQNPNSIVEQDTQEQRAAPPQPPQRWSVEPTAHPMNPQSFMNGPVSPRESGVTPFSSIYPNAPVPPAMQGPVYPPMQAANSNAPLMPRPVYAQAPVQPVGYQGYRDLGGAPPYMRPHMSPGNDGGGGRGGRGRRPKKKRRYPIWARVITAIMLFLMLLAGGGFAYYQIYLSKAVNDITGQTVPLSKGEENPNQGRTGDILSGPRINILLLGSDTDQKFGTSSGGATVYLAQTDIIITIDPATKTVGMLSIPRDFYINIPGYGMGKLDEAFEHGYGIGQGGFNGAVDLSRRTIEQDFGIPINYYAWVGLDGFIKVIDTVGGVDVDVLHPIVDDTYPDDVGNNTGDKFAYKRLYIPPGPQHLSGAAALEYVRSRHADLVGDFGRSARQQQVLSALKVKLADPGIVGQLPQLAKDLDGSVKTDMGLPDILKMMNFARALDPNKINRVVLQPPYSTSTTLPGGESIVQPNCAQIIPAIAQLFNLGNKAVCNITANSNNSMLASAQPSSTVAQPGASADATALQSTGQFVGASAMSLLGGSDNMLGFHSLLDLLFGVVFESPLAMQV